MAHLFARSSAAKALALAGLALVSAPALAGDWIDELDARCNAGQANDCATLGDQLAGGYVTAKDPVRARAAYEKECALDSKGPCVGLYQMLALGIGGPADPVRARQLEAKACHTGILSLQVHLESKGLCKK
ncbi:hypothetical protein [Lysobacter sp. TY2-98]|uniref:hypothetical protein n=1 Tax=Lysobacter sp. TY2-98 TaxID=2290922 RepID=UPI0013B3E7D0|nr:hypothetical protein [Lysobacter sp. TY2-98]